MNAINGAVSQPSSVSGESMQIIAQWLKTHSADGARLDARQRISQRYPLGLLSDAELDALLCGFRKL
jgi:hypothetical protein